MKKSYTEITLTNLDGIELKISIENSYADSAEIKIDGKTFMFTREDWKNISAALEEICS